MAFHEKSAWLMAIALLVGGALYYGTVAAAWLKLDLLLPPLGPMVVVYTVVLTVLAIVGHIAIAVLAPGDANTPVDERERQIFARAGHRASALLAVGILMSLGVYLFIRSGDLLFYTAFASLMVAQIAEYGFRIVYFRSSV